MARTLETMSNAVVAIEYMPESLSALGFDPQALLTWFHQRNFKMYSLGSGGRVTPGLSNELTSKGYLDLIFSRQSIT